VGEEREGRFYYRCSIEAKRVAIGGEGNGLDPDFWGLIQAAKTKSVLAIAPTMSNLNGFKS
jgi:hypothetical protein